jgi:hypothetical protein
MRDPYDAHVGELQAKVADLKRQLAEAQRMIGLQAAALDMWKRAHPDEDGSRLVALAAVKKQVKRKSA